MLSDIMKNLSKAAVPIRKPINKLGTIKIGTVETTPVVFNGELLRFEWVRNGAWGERSERSVGCYRFVRMKAEDEENLAEFADDHSFGCCYTENGMMYAYGVRGPGGGNVIDAFVSRDLTHWETFEALRFPEDTKIFNTSVCRGRDGYIMAIELGAPAELVGKAFTCFFAHSKNLIHWELYPTDTYVYDRGRYTACPTIRYADGFYYMIYLEGAPCHRWLPYIVRSKDLIDWELGVTNPIFFFDDNDKQLPYPKRFSEADRIYIQSSPNTNNSDVDFCEYYGKTVILYSWGNQLGREFLAQAVYDGTEKEFLKSFFAE